MAMTPAGWYPDPSGASGLRYWDGAQWTEHTAPAQAPSPAPEMPAAQAEPTAPAAPPLEPPPLPAAPQYQSPYAPYPQPYGPPPKRSHKGAVAGVIAGVLVLLLIIVIVAAANSGKNNVVTAPELGTNSSPAQGGSPSSPSHAAQPRVAHVGQAISVSSGVSGDKASVTLQQVIDPAHGASEIDVPDPGTRLVAAKLLILNEGKGSLSDDANNDVTLQGSDQQSYTAGLDNVAGCTNFSDGVYTLAPGGSVVGCVVFQLPDGVTAAQAQFSLEGGFGGDTGQWEIP